MKDPVATTDPDREFQEQHPITLEEMAEWGGLKIYPRLAMEIRKTELKSDKYLVYNENAIYVR
jgi:hypothetical protein